MSKHKRTSRRSPWLIGIAVSAALLMVVAAAAILVTRSGDPTIAVVNGEAIKASGLRERLIFEEFRQANQSVPLAENRALLLRSLLNQMIDEALIRQKARELEISASEAEVEARLTAQFGLVGEPGLREIANRTAEATGLSPARARVLWLAQAEHDLLVDRLATALNASEEGGAFPKLLDLWRDEALIEIDEEALHLLGGEVTGDLSQSLYNHLR